jgi:tyrosyl-tRNA synthetase
MSQPSAQAQLDRLKRGIVHLEVEKELLDRLGGGRPLRVKAGFDPTAPDLHLGHTVLIQKMRQFQELGHEVVFIIGDFTAMIGDPTGKSATRPPLSQEQVQANAETYKRQVFKILDPERTRIEFNSSWLARLTPAEMVQLAARYTVQRMLERNDFKARLESGREIAVHEFLYALLQAYDSVAIQADIELGGQDQLWNLLVGRDVMKRYGLVPQMVMTTPLLEGTDAKLVDGKLIGDKMSKSLGNYVGIDEPPAEQYGKLMSISDDLMWRYYELLSGRSRPCAPAIPWRPSTPWLARSWPATTGRRRPHTPRMAFAPSSLDASCPRTCPRSASGSTSPSCIAWSPRRGSASRARKPAESSPKARWTWMGSAPAILR